MRLICWSKSPKSIYLDNKFNKVKVITFLPSIPTRTFPGDVWRSRLAA
jgi:hypothetical protein